MEIKRYALDLTSLSINEIVELQQEYFLTNLRYVGKSKRHYYWDHNRCWEWAYNYSIGGRRFVIDDEELHQTLLKHRTNIAVLILEAIEYELPVLDPETRESTGTTTVVKNLGFITAIAFKDMDKYAEIKHNGYDKYVQSLIDKKEMKQQELAEDSYSSSLDRRSNPYDDYRHELDDMDEADPTWRIANDLD